jgi:hypothetical protein
LEDNIDKQGVKDKLIRNFTKAEESIVKDKSVAHCALARVLTSH